jgi:hypothetical protein
MMLRTYKDKVAVITGAAGGLGRALAQVLAGRKCNLALVDIDSSSLARTTQELGQAGVVVTQHCADVGSEQALENVAAEIATAHGTAHLLINNAAVSGSATFANTGAATFERIMQINFFGVVYGCRVFLPLLQGHAEGQILNVSSCGWRIRKSCGDRSLIQPPAMFLPTVGREVFSCCWPFSRRLGQSSFQAGVGSVSIIVMLEPREFRLQICCGPEQRAVEELAPNGTDQALHERM